MSRQQLQNMDRAETNLGDRRLGPSSLLKEDYKADGER